MIKAGIIGVTGYAGQELFSLLLNHPEVEVSFVTSRSYGGKPLRQVYGNYFNITSINCKDNYLDFNNLDLDVLFIALPHGLASEIITQEFIRKFKIIDLGADYRFKDNKVYEDWYNTEHKNTSLLKYAVYGLCELNRKLIKNSSLVANPGCYTTCSILSLAPLVKEGVINNRSIIIDAKSGVSGAGRGVNLNTHYAECNESVKAYKIASHRHTPEIEEQLNYLAKENFNIVFTPHLVPMNRGILVTAYAELNKELDYDEVKSIYEKYYKYEHFIRLLPKEVFPNTKWVKGSNYIDINFKIDKRTNRIIVIGAIDNLVKGAAGQAVQNMNILFNLKETTGLKRIPLFP